MSSLEPGLFRNLRIKNGIIQEPTLFVAGKVFEEFSEGSVMGQLRDVNGLERCPPCDGGVEDVEVHEGVLYRHSDPVGTRT